MARRVSNDAEPYSGLEVAPFERTRHPAPQHLHDSNYPTQNDQDAAEKQAVAFGHDISEPIVITPKETPQAAYLAAEAPEQEAGSNKNRRRKRKLWTAIVVVALVVMGAIAGGVAGGLLSKHSKAEHPPTPVSSPSPSSLLPTTTTSTPTMSGTAIALASYAFPTAVSWGYPQMEIFALNSAVYPEWKYRQSTSTNSANGGWQPASNSAQPFVSLGGQTATNELGIAATARGTTDVDIFVCGTDQALYTKYHNTSMVWGPSATDWTPLSGVLLSPPTSVSWAPDRLDVFVINTAYGLSQAWWTAQDGWQPYYSFSSQFSWMTYAPTVVSWAENRYDIFLVGSEDQALYHRYFDSGGWEPAADFEKLGGFCTSRPVAVCRAQNQIDVFVRGGDAGLWHISFSQDLPTPQQWSNWTLVSGGQAVQAEPEAVASDSTHLHVFTWGADETLLHRAYNAQTDSWTPENGFETLGEGLSGPPKAVSDAEGSVHVFAYLSDGQLGHKSWNGTSGAWTPDEGFELLGSV